ncbi:sensor histidine kinase [Paenibacillus sp. LHD-117]|uniref:sensor histidine kinase n=1 Tax=Paenibacillus sp. LHD-117 TaxID=3071412 RepID=UPI0027DFA792|nr:sensor histidine kinase [Paenibacillus sp. LHD-117]MDQ6423497.1 sensor histidine kinase [Paenibacillus sp. LHD-117]
MKKISSALGRWNSIHNRIFYSILLFLIIPVMLTFYLLDKPLERVIESKIGRSVQDALFLVNLNVELFLEDMLQSSVDITVNPGMIELLKDPGALTPYEKLRLNDEVLYRPFSSYFTNSYVTVFDLKGNWLSTSYIFNALYKQYTESEWYRDMIDKPYQHRWMFNDKNMLYSDREPIITLARTVTDLQTSRNIGMIAFSVAEEDIRPYLTGLEGDVYLVNREGIVVSSPSTGMIGEPLPNGIDAGKLMSERTGQHILESERGKWIVNHDTVQINGWKIVQIVSYDTVFKEIFDIRQTNIEIIALIFIVFTIITLSISYTISKPLKLLKKRMTELEGKQFYSAIAVAGPEEISSLIETYNKMVKEIRGLLVQVKEEYEQKEEMRFRALQAQINPHFILNTLNNIKWMAYIRGNGDVGDMLSNLGGILEGSIGRSGSLIPLKEEIDYIENYIGLMKLKYHDKLSLKIDIAEEWMDQEVVRIMLQPVIENSLIHGIEKIDKPGLIEIKAARDEERFVLTVSDNGPGIPDDRMRELDRRLRSGSEEPPPERIGLKNVHDRIRMQYGEAYGISISGSPGNGTTVRFVLPARKAERRMNDDV